MPSFHRLPWKICSLQITSIVILEWVLDLDFVRDMVRLPMRTGRPSIDPVVFFKLQLVLFFEGLRSERQLMRVVADRFAVRRSRARREAHPLTSSAL